MNEIDKISARFVRAYDRQKKAKTWLEKSQRILFSELTNLAANETRPQRSVLIPEGFGYAEYVARYHPGWQIASYYEPNGVILEEDPAFVTKSYTNDLGVTVGRIRVEASPELDDDRLKSENLALWECISEWPEPWWSLIRECISNGFSIEVSDDVLDSMTADFLESHGIQRVLKDLNTVDVEDLTMLQNYILPGKVSVRLSPPKVNND